MNSWSTFLSLSWALFWAGVVATLGAGALWATALRGRVSDWHPSCARCRFRLHAVPPQLVNCPECGAKLEPRRAIVPAARSWSAVAFFAAFLLSAVAALAFVANQPTTLPRIKEWWRSLQSVESLMDAAATDPDDAWRELTRRLSEQKLSPRDIDDVLDFARRSAIAPPNSIATYDAAIPFLRAMTRQSCWTPARRRSLLDFLLDHNAVTVTSAGTFAPGKSIALIIQVTSNLDPSQSAMGSSATSWPGLQITVESVQVGRPGGPPRDVRQLSSGQSAPGQFASVAFFAPDEPGDYRAEITARFSEANDASSSEHFARTLVIPWSFKIRDPAAALIAFQSDPQLAERVRQWLADSRIEMEAPRPGAAIPSPGLNAPAFAAVVLPVYPANLLPPDLSLAYHVTVTQGSRTVDAGQLWMAAPFTSGYKGQLTAFAIPPQWNAALPVALTFEPDPELALRRGSHEGRALLDKIEVADLKMQSVSPARSSAPAPAHE